jgi:hypothetical protein
MYDPTVKTTEPILAERLGTTVHVSPLRRRLEAMQKQFPSPGAECLEDWLVDVANTRGACVVARPDGPPVSWQAPSVDRLSHEELIVAICQLQCRDRPQMLRLAAQLVSRKAAGFRGLQLLAERERAGLVLGELARQALRVDPNHALWRQIAEVFPSRRPLRAPILHWTRLAEPVMVKGRCNAHGWRLAA